MKEDFADIIGMLHSADMLKKSDIDDIQYLNNLLYETEDSIKKQLSSKKTIIELFDCLNNIIKNNIKGLDNYIKKLKKLAEDLNRTQYHNDKLSYEFKHQLIMCKSKFLHLSVRATFLQDDIKSTVLLYKKKQFENLKKLFEDYKKTWKYFFYSIINGMFGGKTSLIVENSIANLHMAIIETDYNNNLNDASLILENRKHDNKLIKEIDDNTKYLKLKISV